MIAATNSKLEAEVQAGRFREDLYYRLNVVALHLPPLRERPRDVLMLAERFLERFASEHGRPARKLSREAALQLAQHSWPGNVRELEHALERAVLLGTEAELRPADLGAPFARAALPAAVEHDPRERPGALFPLDLGRPLREALEGPEREIIRLTLELCGGSRQETARRLGLNRATLFNKMRKYGLFEIPTRTR